MKNATFKRFLSLVLALTMVLSYGILPAAATEEEEAVCNHTYENGVCTSCQQNKPCSLELNCDAPDHVDECLSQATCSCTILCSETMSCPVCEAGGECKGQPDTQPEPIVCDGTENCAAETHETTCACYDPCVALGCTEDAHHADCPYGQPCTLTEGCEKFNGHLGECTGMTEYTDPVVTDPVAKIGDEGFATLADAVAAVETSATITLVENITLTETIVIPTGKNISLDLNGKNITGSVLAFQVAGTLSLSGNGIVSGSDGVKMMENGALTVSGDVTLTGTDCAIYSSADSKGNFTVTISGGTIKSDATRYSAVQFNGTNTNVTMNITGGSIEAKVVGIYFACGGNLNISGTASVTAATAVIAKNGTTTISGGTFTGNGEKVAYTENNNGQGSTGDALAVINSGYGPVKVSVSGGSFHSTNADAVGSYPATNQIKGFITGGTFSNSVTPYLALGYTQNSTTGAVSATTIPSAPAGKEVNVSVDTSKVNQSLPSGVEVNTAVSNTNVENVIDDATIKSAITGVTDAAGATGVEISMQVVISGYTANETSTVLTFDVAPHIQPVDNNKNPVGSGATVSETAEDVTFRLPMPDGTKGKIANVHHKHGSSSPVLFGAYEIQGDEEGKNCYIELKSSQFSEWSVTILKDASLSAEISGTNYTSLEDALAAAQDGDTLKLLGNVELTKQLILDKDITLDGNGYEIKVKENITSDFYDSAANNTFMVSVTGDVTIKNVTLDANATEANAATQPAGIQFYMCEGTLQNVAIKNVKRWCAVHINAAEVTVSGDLSVSGTAGYGSHIALGYGEGIPAGTPVKLTISPNAKLTGVTDVYGKPEHSSNGDEYEITVPDGCGVTPTAVAKIGNTYYTTLAAAVADGGNVELLMSLADIYQMTDTITVNKKVNLDLENGTEKYSISISDSTKPLFTVANGGELTISNGTYNGALTVSGTGKLAISDGTFNGAVTATSISGGTFNGAVTATSISGGTFNAAVSGTATITGGTFNSTVSGTATITGGTFNSTVSGAATIQGGTFESTVSTTVAITATVPGTTAGSTVANPARFKTQPTAIATGCYALKDGNYYVIREKDYVTVGTGSTATKYYYGGEYANFEAVFKATAPNTYTLSRNETFNSAYTMTTTGETIINLNGHTITGTGSITSGGSLTINNIGYRDAVNGKAYYMITLGAGDKATFAADGSIRFNVAPNGSLTYGSMGWTEVYPTTTYVKVCHMETPTSVIFYTNGSYSTSDSILLQDPTANGLPLYYITAVKNNTTLSNSFVYGSSAVMVFESNGFYSGLSKVIVTGSNYYKDLTRDTHFSADKGSTIVTLKNSYLKTLPKGNYTLTIQYQDGNTAATNFYVVSSPKPASNPQTGDVILTSVIIMVAAAAGLGVLIYLGKKKKK